MWLRLFHILSYSFISFISSFIYSWKQDIFSLRHTRKMRRAITLVKSFGPMRSQFMIDGRGTLFPFCDSFNSLSSINLAGIEKPPDRTLSKNLLVFFMFSFFTRFFNFLLLPAIHRMGLLLTIVRSTVWATIVAKMTAAPLSLKKEGQQIIWLMCSTACTLT